MSVSDPARNLYQTLALHRTGLSLSDLARKCLVAEDEAAQFVAEMRAQGLVTTDGAIVCAVPWWDQGHLEVSLEVPRLRPEAFVAYCRGIDLLNEELRSRGFNTLRPYRHETTIEIVLGAAAALVISDFVRTFVIELARHLASFVASAVAQYRVEGLEEVRITMERITHDGQTLILSVRGADVRTITERLAIIADQISEQSTSALGELSIKGEGWSATVRKKAGSGRPVSVFVSYSHEDDESRRDLDKHLKLFQRLGIIQTWDDRRLTAGDEWRKEIDQQLRNADLILLLVSADFIASDYAYEVEMQMALARHEKGEARVIPIIVRDCYWKEAPFAKLQALPQNAKPVRLWEDQDSAWRDVAQGIENAISALHLRL